MTPVPSIESFPPWAQVVLTIGGFLLTVGIYARSLLKPANVQQGKDVVLPNINVMDAQAIREAADQLRRNIAQNEHRDQIVRQLQTELGEQTRVMKEQRDLLEAIERRMKLRDASLG